jgi:hypothetical protein
MKEFYIEHIEYDYDIFRITYSDDLEYFFEFEVHEVVGWDPESTKPIEFEPYVKGEIKWDGCSHVWFGEQEAEKDGYLHLCGAICWNNHINLMKKLYEFAAENIKQYSKDAAE